MLLEKDQLHYFNSKLSVEDTKQFTRIKTGPKHFKAVNNSLVIDENLYYAVPLYI